LGPQVVGELFQNRAGNLRLLNVRAADIEHAEVQIDRHPYRHQQHHRQRQRKDQLKERDAFRVLVAISLNSNQAADS